MRTGTSRLARVRHGGTLFAAVCALWCLVGLSACSPPSGGADDADGGGLDAVADGRAVEVRAPEAAGGDAADAWRPPDAPVADAPDSAARPPDVPGPPPVDVPLPTDSLVPTDVALPLDGAAPPDAGPDAGPDAAPDGSGGADAGADAAVGPDAGDAGPDVPGPSLCGDDEDCVALVTECRAATCEDGVCRTLADDDGLDCDDGDACTRADRCLGGRCVGGPPPSCDDLDPCTVDDCEPQAGCTHDAGDDGVPCDDGDPCSAPDTCRDGACAPGPGACECVDDGDCAAVDDEDRCNGVLRCGADGACEVRPGSRVDCADETVAPCNVPACVPETGACAVEPLADGTACDDGDACTATDTCQAGVCSGAAPVVCAASDACHGVGTCDPATGRCDDPAAPDGTACDDDDPCTAPDQCAAGVCQPGPASCECRSDADCGAVDDDDRCNGVLGCRDDVCVVVPGSPVDCSGLAVPPCHVASCVPATGECVAVPGDEGGACDDGDACTTVDTCQSGVCTGTAPVTCSAAGACRAVGSCDPATGACSDPPAPDGTPCNDGDACTTVDSCQGGACAGTTPVVCAAADPCHVAGTCDPTSGACSDPPAEDGSPCDDGSACTAVDSCQSGQCEGTGPVVCAAPDPCHLAGTCDPGTGLCDDPPAPAGAPCDDGDPCTGGDGCLGGVCQPGAGDGCDDGDPCTTDACLPGVGCDNTPFDSAEAVAACDTGVAGPCQAGRVICVGGAALCLPELDGYGAAESVAVPGGLHDRITGVSGPGLVTSNGVLLFELASAYDGVPYTGWTVRSFDPARGFETVHDFQIESPSFYTDGVFADAHAIYPIEWTGAGAARIVRIDLGTHAVTPLGTIPQLDGAAQSPISAQYDPVREKVWVGSLYAGQVLRFATPFALDPESPTGGAEAVLTLEGAAGAGVVTSDGTYLYVKRWAGYPGDDVLRRYGTGYGGTVAGKAYGPVGDDARPYGLSGTYHPDGWIYLPDAVSSTQLLRVRATAATVERCNGRDDDCDGVADDGVAAFRGACDDGSKCTADTCDGLDCASAPGADPCGDRVVDTECGETCDDGNRTGGDGCDAACQAESCGDGVLYVDHYEQCDDGALNSDVLPDACRTDCLLPRCGDGVVDSDEECDDGDALNLEAPPDGCRRSCRRAFCGDGVLDTGEACDDQNTVAGDGCDAACVVEFCGDGVIQAALGETCDDGGNDPDDGCSAACAVESCGDGVVQAGAGEACDAGPNGDRTCAPDCTLRPCGTEERCDLVDNDCDGQLDEGCAGPVVMVDRLDSAGGGQQAVMLNVGCQSEYDCNDQNVETTDACVSGQCQWTPIPCDGQDADACTDGRRFVQGGPCVNTGPVLLWDFEEPVGSLVVDESGSGNFGTPRRARRLAAGLSGAALDVSGDPTVEASQGYVARAMTLPTTDFTLSAWFRTTRPTGGLFAALAGDKPVGDATIPADRSVQLVGGVPAYALAPATTFTTVGAGSGPVADGAWHHVALACRKDVACQLYVDGVVTVTSANYYETDSTLVNQTRFVVGWTPAGGWFDGQIDHVALHEYPLDAAAVAQLMGGVLTAADGRNRERCDGQDWDCNGTPDDACTDGDECTVGDVCAAGTCAGQPRAVASDGNDCTATTCDALTGLAVHTPLTSGSCDDGRDCTTDDACVAGRCQGTVGDCGTSSAWLATSVTIESDGNRTSSEAIIYSLAGSDVLGCIVPLNDTQGSFGAWQRNPANPNHYYHHGPVGFATARPLSGNRYDCTTFWWVLTTDLDVGLEPFTLGGKITVPFPNEGFMADIGLSPPPVSVNAPYLALGISTGQSLRFLNAPLDPGREYLFLSGLWGIQMLFPGGAMPPLSLPGSVQASVVIDPSDPAFYVSFLGNQTVKDGLDKAYDKKWKIPGSTVVNLKAGALGFSLHGNLVHKAVLSLWDGQMAVGPDGFEKPVFFTASNPHAHFYTAATVALTPFDAASQQHKTFTINLTGRLSLSFDPNQDGYDPARATSILVDKILRNDWQDGAGGAAQDLDFRLLLDGDIGVGTPPFQLPGTSIGVPSLPLPLANAALLIDTTPSRELVSFRGKTAAPWKAIPGTEFLTDGGIDLALDLNGFVKRVGDVVTWGLSADLALPLPVAGHPFGGRLEITDHGFKLTGNIDIGKVKFNPELDLGVVGPVELSFDGTRFCAGSPTSVNANSVDANGAARSTTCQVTVCVGKDGLAGSQFQCAPLCLGHAECDARHAGDVCVWGICGAPIPNGAPCPDSGSCASDHCLAGFCVECWPGQAECGAGTFCDNAGYCQDKLGLGAPCVGVGLDVMRHDWCLSGSCDTLCVECVPPSITAILPYLSYEDCRDDVWGLDCPWHERCTGGTFCGNGGHCTAPLAAGESCYSTNLITGVNDWCASKSCGDPTWTCRECGVTNADGVALTCPSDEYCLDYIGPASTYRCLPRVPDDTLCTADQVCYQGHLCGSSNILGSPVCYHPNSKAYGENCLVQAACTSGQCLLLGEDVGHGSCGCNGDDGQCPNGWCDLLGYCQPKKPDGEVCYADRECTSGFCPASAPIPGACTTRNSEAYGSACFLNAECTSANCQGGVQGVAPGSCGCAGTDGHCPDAAGGQVCVSGNHCVYPAATGLPCTSGDDRACQSGHCSVAFTCVECEANAHCAAHYECAAGTCVFVPYCGDGTCVIATGETCATCPADCACAAAYACAGAGVAAVCTPADLCGNGTCNAEAPQLETCGTCPGDCACGGTQYCDGVACQAKKANGAVCYTDAECTSGYCPASPPIPGACTTANSEPYGSACFHDAECTSSNCQGAVQGVAPGTCGCGGADARCPDAAGGQRCVAGNLCVYPAATGLPCTSGDDRACQSGHCSAALTCVECESNGHCADHYECAAGTCVFVPYCGDAACVVAQGETCATCPADCGCGGLYTCTGVGAAAACTPANLCGNGTCNSAFPQLETCLTCPADCGCGSGSFCDGGSCIAKKGYGAACAANNDECASGQCVAVYCGCNWNDGWCSGGWCDGYACYAKKAGGEGCGSAHECLSGICRNGGCGCAGDGDCPSARFCNGAGECQLDYTPDFACDRGAMCTTGRCINQPTSYTCGCSTCCTPVIGWPCWDCNCSTCSSDNWNCAWPHE